RAGSFGWHQVVLLGENVQHRHRDVLEIHPATAELDLALDEPVALVELLGELPERLAGLVRTVEDPLLHPHEVARLDRVVEDVYQIEVLLPGQPERLERQIGPVEHLARDVAQGVHHQVDVYIPGPEAQQVGAGVEVHGGDGRDEVLDLGGVKRAVAEAEGAALADTHQVDGIHLVPAAQDVHAAVDVAVDIVVQSEIAVARVGIAPIDQVDVEPALEQAPDDRAVLLEIDHVRPVHQRVHDEHRYRVLDFDERAEAVEDQLVLLVDRLLVGGADRRVSQIAQRLQSALQARAELASLGQRLLRADLEWQ